VRYGISLTFVLLAEQTLFAQQAVQQPIVGTTAVNTSVSVPDRGTTLLGGVSSAQSGRSQYGPFPSGSSRGFSRQSTSVSATVQIIDLNEMDQALLNASPIPADKSAVEPQKPAIRRVADVTSTPGESPVQKAAAFEKLARDAEKSGKTSIAKLYWQAAEKHGSKAAKKRLAEFKPSHQTTPLKAH